jgi:hypothetical protein
MIHKILYADALPSEIDNLPAHDLAGGADTHDGHAPGPDIEGHHMMERRSEIDDRYGVHFSPWRVFEEVATKEYERAERSTGNAIEHERREREKAKPRHRVVRRTFGDYACESPVEHVSQWQTIEICGQLFLVIWNRLRGAATFWIGCRDCPPVLMRDDNDDLILAAFVVTSMEYDAPVPELPDYWFIHNQFWWFRLEPRANTFAAVSDMDDMFVFLLSGVNQDAFRRAWNALCRQFVLVMSKTLVKHIVTSFVLDPQLFIKHETPGSEWRPFLEECLLDLE